VDYKRSPSDTRKPNIIIILADDMGFSDIGCYGAEIQTPNLDRMAKNGVRFTQMYNCARCCPTRASLLTGLYPHQAGVGHMVDNKGTRAYQGYLRDDCVTLAEVLREAGCRTLMSGKWHVGGRYLPNKPETWHPGEAGYPIPVQRGFDKHYGFLGGAGSYFHPPYMVKDATIISTPPEGYYLTDALTDEAVHLIEESAAETMPFFLYLAYTAPHWPLHALPEDIAKYQGTYRRGGWDGVRTARHEELKGMGILNPEWDISPRDRNAPAWPEIKERDWEDLRMAVYAAQVHRMDQGIGKIMSKLRELGIEDDTLIAFLSDNGGCAEFVAEDTDRPEPDTYNIPTPDGRLMHVGNTPSISPGPDDTFTSYDLPWANASNTPFRFYKHWVHEGGISTPFIVQWPAVIAGGRIEDAPCHVADIMPTCLEAAGADYPAEFNGRKITPVEGESLMPVFRGRDWTRERPIFWEHEGNRAMRDGEWKLVSRFPGQWELYNMIEDRTEMNDMAEALKAKKEELIKLYCGWAERCEIREWPFG